MSGKKSTRDIPFWLFMVIALAAGVIYLLWGQRNTADTLYQLGFLRYRASEQLQNIESWERPDAEREAAEAALEAAAAWAAAQETVSGTYVTDTAAAVYGEETRLTLGYTLYGPETGKTVILLHAFCDEGDVLLPAEYWVSRGFRVLVPVQRGYADPAETNVYPTTFGVYEALDLYDLIQTLALENETLFLHGKGAGAAAALLLAADESLADAGVDGLVLESVYDHLGATERALLKQLFRLGDTFVGRFLRDLAEKRLGFAPDRIDLTEAAAKLQTKTLFLCSNGDAFLGAARTEAVANACRGEKIVRHLQGGYRSLWLSDGEAYRAGIDELLG